VIVEDVVTVIIVEIFAPTGVIVAGEKLHDAPEGSPEQLKATAELNPSRGVTAIVIEPLFPGAKVSDAGEAAIEKSEGGKGKLIVY
jgi:hypothetical protein